jgi:hypothetical protein
VSGVKPFTVNSSIQRMAATLATGMICTSATFSSDERSQPTTWSHGSDPLVGRR